MGARSRYNYNTKKLKKPGAELYGSAPLFHLPGWLSLSCRRCAAVAAAAIMLGRATPSCGVGPHCSSSWWVRHRSFLFVDPPCPLRDPSSPAEVGLDSLSLVSIRCRWFRFAAVGFDSPSLVSSGPGWFPRCLITPSPQRLTLPSPQRLAPPSPRVACSPSPRIVPSLPSRPSSISPLVLLIISPPPHRPSPSTLVPSPFLIVVVSPLIGVDSVCRFVLVTG